MKGSVAAEAGVTVCLRLARVDNVRKVAMCSNVMVMMTVTVTVIVIVIVVYF
jgi:hypothetical protein